MILQLLINTLTGASTGYITNNIAIKMLFKKYFGRFGGMIEDTHEEFVQNISALIEKDLINHTTLSDEFESDAFRGYVKVLIQDMFEESLPKYSIPLSDIKGMQETKNNLYSFLETHQEHCKNIKNEILQIPAKEIISQKQVTQVSKALATTLSTQKSDILEILFASLKNFQLDSLITKELISQLRDNIKNIIYGIKLSKYDKEISKTMQALLTALKIDKILDIIQEEIENLYIKQFFKNPQESVQNILELFLQIALSDAGQEAIFKSVNIILEHIKMIESSVLDLLDDSLKTSIKLFIQRELPTIIEKIVAFIDKNEKELEVLINNSIDKALSKGLFSSIKKKIVSILYTNIVQDFKVLAQAKEFMYENREKAQEEISEQIIDILENRSIGSLYTIISTKKIITPQKITDLIIHNLQQLKSDKKYHLIDVTLHKKVKELTSVDMSFVKKQFIPYTFQTLKKEYLYTDKLQAVLFEETLKFITRLQRERIETILHGRVEALQNSIVHAMDEAKILDIILTNANNVMQKPLYDTVDASDITVDYQTYIDDFVAHKSIKDIVTQLQSEEVYLALEGALVKIIVDNLEVILQGNVSQAVQNELKKLPPSQIKEMVEEFMGDELKPINYFGAFLGGITGLGVGTLSLPVIVNPFIYGVVGVATNYLAIKMLFRPFTPLTIVGLKIPLTQGVLPSNKPKMATKMSEFVDEFMLNGTSIEDFFTHNSTRLQAFIKEHIAKDDYAILDTLIHQHSNSQDVSNELITLLFSFLQKNQVQISQKLFSIFLTFYHNRKTHSQKVSEIIFNKAMKTDFSHFLAKLFEQFIEKEKSLEFLSNDILQELNSYRDIKFEQLIELLTDSEKLKDILHHFESNFSNLTRTKSLSGILNSSFKQSITRKANASLVNLFYGHGTINELLNFFTKGEFTPQTKLSDMINGMLPDIIKNNLNMIIEESVLPALRENKKSIRSEILKKLPFGSGLFAKQDINRTIDIILDEEIPQFINTKIEEINLVAQEVLDTKIEDLGYKEGIINQTKVDDLITNILTSQKFTDSLQDSMFLFLETIFEMKLEEILKLFGITSLDDIYSLFEKNICTIMKELFYQLTNNKEELLHLFNTLTQETIIPDILKDVTLKDLLQNIDTKMLETEFQHLLHTLKSSKNFTNALQNIITSFTQEFLQKEFLDEKTFQDDLSNFLNHLLQNKENLRVVLLPFLTSFLNQLNKILDLRLKDHTIDILTQAAFESIHHNITGLIQAVDFKKVITTEINAMHPKELEDMFYSFAGPYFNKLIMYGSLGFFFGLLTLFQV